MVILPSTVCTCAEENAFKLLRTETKVNRLRVSVIICITAARVSGVDEMFMVDDSTHDSSS